MSTYSGNNRERTVLLWKFDLRKVSLPEREKVCGCCRKNVIQADFFCPFVIPLIEENNSCHFQKKKYFQI